MLYYVCIDWFFKQAHPRLSFSNELTISDSDTSIVINY